VYPLLRGVIITETAAKAQDGRGVTRHAIRVFFPIVLTAMLLLLWADSRRTPRRLLFLPAGDAALGVKSQGGWVSRNEFTPWDDENSEQALFCVPYWSLVAVCLALAWRAVALWRRDRRFRRWEGAVLGAIVLLLAALQGRTDPVAHLLKAIRQPPDEYALHDVYEAVAQVNRAGRGNEVAVPLISLLDDRDSVLGVRAARALRKLRADPRIVVPALTAKHTDRKLRYFVTVTLGEIGLADDCVLPALIQLLKDEYPEIRVAAVSALREMGPAAVDAVPALTEELDDKSIRLEVLYALAGMGPSAKAAVPALTELLKTATGYDQLLAAQALWKIDENVDLVVPALIRALNDPFMPIRRDAADALGEIGPRARAAIPALIATRDYKPQPRPKAKAPAAGDGDLPVVTEMPEDEFYPQVRDAAVRAIANIKDAR
jgi:HEAT repeat protein